MGLGVPGHAAARGRRAAGWRCRYVPAHVNETTDPVDNLGGILSVAARRGARARDQLRAVPDDGHARARARRDRARRRRSRSSSASAAPARRSTTSTIAGRRDLLGRRVRRHHRLRVADGRDVRRPAVPAERARLLDARGRAPRSCRRPSAMVLVRPALGEARRGARRALHPARRLRRSACSASSRCSCSGRRTSPTGRSALGYALVGVGVGFAGTPASHSLTGSVPVSAPAWRRARPTSSATSAARSCSRSSARCSPPATRRRWPRRSRPRRTRRRSPTSTEASSRSRSPSAEEVAEQYPQYADADHRRRQVVVPRRRRLGLHGRDRRDPARRGARLLPVPARARGGGAARPLRRRGRRGLSHRATR